MNDTTTQRKEGWLIHVVILDAIHVFLKTILVLFVQVS
jgi:hypothetical protein